MAGNPLAEMQNLQDHELNKNVDAGQEDKDGKNIAFGAIMLLGLLVQKVEKDTSQH